MTNVTTLHQDAPAVPAEPLLRPADKATMLGLLRLPDVSGMMLPPDPTIQDLADLHADLADALRHAGKIYAEAIREIVEMCLLANEQVGRMAPEYAKAVPHASLEIKIERTGERGRDVALLREALPALNVPPDEILKAVFIKALDVKGVVDVPKINALIEGGAKPVWDCDLRALDKIGRDYGGEVQAVVTKATAHVPLAKPKVTITRKPPAMKSVSEVIAS